MVLLVPDSVCFVALYKVVRFLPCYAYSVLSLYRHRTRSTHSLRGLKLPDARKLARLVMHDDDTNSLISSYRGGHIIQLLSQLCVPVQHVFSTPNYLHSLAVMDGLLYDLTITYFIPYYYYIGHDILRFSEYIVH